MKKGVMLACILLSVFNAFSQNINNSINDSFHNELIEYIKYTKKPPYRPNLVFVIVINEEKKGDYTISLNYERDIKLLELINHNFTYYNDSLAVLVKGNNLSEVTVQCLSLDKKIDIYSSKNTLKLIKNKNIIVDGIAMSKVLHYKDYKLLSNQYVFIDNLSDKLWMYPLYEE